MKYVCELCGKVYLEAQGDPAHGIAPGTAFAELPEYYECPGCGSGKEAMNPVVPNAVPQPTEYFGHYHKYSDDTQDSQR